MRPAAKFLGALWKAGFNKLIAALVRGPAHAFWYPASIDVWPHPLFAYPKAQTD